MAKLTVLGSSSKGNGYILDCGGEQLIIEAGVHIKAVLMALHYDLNNVVGAICTHQHIDHASYLSQYVDYGIKTFSPKNCNTLDRLGTIVEHKKKCKIGNFAIMPLKVPHNVECFSYVIQHKDIGTLVFATDLMEFPYNVKCDNLMIECNYSEDVIVKAMMNNSEVRAQSSNHMELDECINTIKRLNKGQLNKVILLHLSDNYSDEDMFRKEIFKATGIRPIIAYSGLEVELQKEEF
jgi:phosphoribosyl 1,2-cyclic phosphodiesterase